MRVTYIKHSGFLVEWEDMACLFDFAEGELPALDAEKRLFVFASHAHADHYVPEIFSRCAAHPRRTFLLSDDIRELPAAADPGQVIRMGPDRRRIFPGGRRGPLSVSTLGSTDQGVAFVVSYGGETVYHAGDLHWWAWPDDTPQEERDMKKAFFAELVKLKGMRLDAAFLPLDPRLGGNFWMGFDALMRSARVKTAFPMHMWEKYDIVTKLRQMSVSEPYREAIADVREPGQVFEI